MRDRFMYIAILDGMSLTNEDEGGAIEYYGYTKPGGGYGIMKRDVASGEYTYYLANGIANYPSDWIGRAGLSYVIAGTLTRL